MRLLVDVSKLVELAKGRPGLVLGPSKKNPKVKRWMKAGEAQGAPRPVTPAGPAPSRVNPPTLLTPQEASLPKKTAQPTKDPDELFRMAEEGQAKSVELLSDLAAKIGGKTIRADQGQHVGDMPPEPAVVIGPMKRRDRSEAKVMSENEGDWSSLLDIVRATVSVPSYDQVPAVLDLVRKTFPPARAPKDRFANPVAGYRDILYNYTLPSGMVAELQIAVHPMLEAKGGPGHKVYEKIREITGPIQEAKRQPTAEELSAVSALTEESESIYAQAWGKAYGQGPADLRKAVKVAEGVKYYDYDGLPAVERPGDFAHIVRPGGREDRVYDQARWIQNAQEIGEADFEQLVSEQSAS